MTKTETVPCHHLTSPISHKVALAMHGRCRSCNGTGIVLKCTGCRIVGCDGNCDCSYCLGEQTISCENDACDQGRIVDADGDMTDAECPACKGRGQVCCPRC